MDEAREHAHRAEELADLTHCILDRVSLLEARPLRVSAYVLAADAARRRQDEQAAESALAAASSQLWEWSLSCERAEYCFAVARLRKDQARFDEAFALARRAGEMYETLGEDVAAAEAFLAMGGWCMEATCLHEAAGAYAAGLSQGCTASQVLVGLGGLARVSVLLSQLEVALAVVRSVRRERLPKASYEALALGILEGQMLLKRGLVRSARRELDRSFNGLLAMGKPEDALYAGLALLLAGASGAADLAVRMQPIVPRYWPDLAAALAEVIAQGHLPDERRDLLSRYLFLAAGCHDW